MINSMFETFENDILDVFKHNRTAFLYGKKEKKIFIDSGAANDEIIDYELVLRESNSKKEREVSFKTSASIFPRSIQLSDYSSVDLEEYNGNLFVHVQ